MTTIFISFIYLLENIMTGYISLIFISFIYLLEKCIRGMKIFLLKTQIVHRVLKLKKFNKNNQTKNSKLSYLLTYLTDYLIKITREVVK